jgi:hypothetical protein
MVDRYTKAVLTVIAAALVLLLIQGAVTQSRAQFNRYNEIQKVQLCNDVACADLIPTGGNRRGWALAVSSN